MTKTMIVDKELSWLKPAVYNPRKDLKPGDPAYDSLRKSIEHFGHVQIIVANKNGTVIGGHQTLKVLKELKRETAPVMVLDLKERDEKALNIALNKIHGDWDMPKLSELLVELDAGDIDIDLTGFTEIDLKDILEKGEVAGEDEAPPVPKNPITKLGDIWTLGEHRLLCGDSTDDASWLALLGKDVPDLVFTDPPYGVDYGKKNRILNKFDKAGRNHDNIENDNISRDDLFLMLVTAFSHARDHVADHCSFYVTAPQGGELGMMMMMMMDKAKLPTRHVLIWNKNVQNFSLGRLDYEYKHEPILYTWKKTHRWNGAGEFKNSVWDISKELKCDVHPTMKPVQLVENAILNSSKKGDIVLDFFGGSGTTMIAADKTGRQCRMMELTPGYCDVIIERWEKFTGKKAIRKSHK